MFPPTRVERSGDVVIPVSTLFFQAVEIIGLFGDAQIKTPVTRGWFPARRRTAFEFICYLSLSSLFYKRRSAASADFDDSVFKALGQSRPSLSETLTKKERQDGD